MESILGPHTRIKIPAQNGVWGREEKLNVERWVNGLLVIRKDRYTAGKRDKGEKVAKVE